MASNRELNLRDKAQHFLIFELFSSRIADNMIFCGGTMLQVCGIPNYRYSQDVDIKLDRITFEEFYTGLDKCIKKVGDKSEIDVLLQRDAVSAEPYLLCVDRKSGEMAFIGLDVNQLEDWEHPKTDFYRIQPNHSELDVSGSPAVLCYSLTQVLAIKFGCLPDREFGRDLYDFWFLGRDEGMLQKAWRLHVKSCQQKPRKIHHKMIAQKLRENADRLITAVTLEDLEFSFKTKIPPHTIVQEAIAMCAKLPGMLE